jgi:hypothetical protein
LTKLVIIVKSNLHYGEINAASKAAAKKSQAEAAKYLKNWLTIRFNEVGKIINGLNTR